MMILHTESLDLAGRNPEGSNLVHASRQPSCTFEGQHTRDDNACEWNRQLK